MNFDTIIIRYGEIGLKSKQTRKKFVKKLVQNMKEVLKADFIDYDDIRIEFGRIFVDTGEKEALKVLPKVFGIKSISPAQYTRPDLDSISELSLEYAKRIKKTDKFAIRARRSGGQKFTSMELAVKIGDLVRKKTKAKVDLKNPTKELFIEVRAKRSYVFTDNIRGPGGIPRGIEGKVIGLYSKGLGFKKSIQMMAKRGCDVEILCNTGEKREVEKLARSVLQGLGQIKIHTTKKPKDKKELYSIANKLCTKSEAKAVVTAEKLTKNSLKEFSKYDKFSKYPIFRPLG